MRDNGGTYVDSIFREGERISVSVPIEIAAIVPVSTMEPYTIAVPEDKLASLAQKLSTTTFPDELDDAGWDYGAPLADIKKLVKYWQEGYDWRKQEAELNKLPNYLANIHIDGFETLDLHFLHEKSEFEGAIPLLFSHGCKLIGPAAIESQGLGDVDRRKGPVASSK